MTFDEASQRVAALRAELEHHNRLYYQQAAPQISDSQYGVIISTGGVTQLARVDKAAVTVIATDVLT